MADKSSFPSLSLCLALALHFLFCGFCFDVWILQMATRIEFLPDPNFFPFASTPAENIIIKLNKINSELDISNGILHKTFEFLMRSKSKGNLSRRYYIKILSKCLRAIGVRAWDVISMCNIYTNRDMRVCVCMRGAGWLQARMVKEEKTTRDAIADDREYLSTRGMLWYRFTEWDIPTHTNEQAHAPIPRPPPHSAHIHFVTFISVLVACNVQTTNPMFLLWG